MSLRALVPGVCLLLACSSGRPAEVASPGPALSRQPAVAGDPEKIEHQRGSARMFVGAREMFQRGDAELARRATRRARFVGGAEPFALLAAGSPGENNRGHAVASLLSSSASERDEGVAFAQSIAVIPSP